MSNMINQEEIETLRELIKDIDTAMLTTVTEEGLVSRPMKTQEVEFDGDLWFFTKKETAKYEEILVIRMLMWLMQANPMFPSAEERKSLRI